MYPWFREITTHWLWPIFWSQYLPWRWDFSPLTDSQLEREMEVDMKKKVVASKIIQVIMIETNKDRYMEHDEIWYYQEIDTLKDEISILIDNYLITNEDF